MPNFQASVHFLHDLKKELKVSSRKITKYLTVREIRREEIDETISDFVKLGKERVHNYNHDHVLNTDQSGYNYEMVSTRTLSEMGEKSTECAITSANKITHSYSIQVTISASGRLVGPVFLYLQEPQGLFGPRVLDSLPGYDNVYLVCSSSGKLTKHLFREWCEVILPEITERTLLFKDSWTGQSDQNMFIEIFGENLEVLTIPPKTTGKIQPLDLFVFSQWKKFYRRGSDYVKLYDINVDLTQRYNVIRMHSLIHNQISSPRFSPMLRYSWQKAEYLDVEPEEFESVTQVCFRFTSNCSKCQSIGFMRCSWCDSVLCFTHFFNEMHVHN